MFLNKKPIGESVLLECYEKTKQLKGIGTVKLLVSILLAGYMHLIDPIGLLWSTVSKGTTGPTAISRATAMTKDLKKNSL